MDKAIKVSKYQVWVVAPCIIGHYRGEDSGAIYPEYEYNVIEAYRIASLLDHKINGKTIEELIDESNRRYPYAGELHTSEQAFAIFNYVKSLPNVDDYKVI